MNQKHPNADLAWRALKGALFFVVALWLLIFLPAGSLSYWQGWLLWAHFTAWTAGGTWYLLKHDPALVQRRLRAGPTAEQDPVQKRIQLLLAIAMSAMFLVSALDYRYGWSAVSWPIVIASNLLFAIGYLFILMVLRENSFASSTIEVAWLIAAGVRPSIGSRPANRQTGSEVRLRALAACACASARTRLAPSRSPATSAARSRVMSARAVVSSSRARRPVHAIQIAAARSTRTRAPRPRHSQTRGPCSRTEDRSRPLRRWRDTKEL